MLTLRQIGETSWGFLQVYTQPVISHDFTLKAITDFQNKVRSGSVVMAGSK